MRRTIVSLLLLSGCGDDDDTNPEVDAAPQHPCVMTVSASGSATLPLEDAPGPLTNGDFLIESDTNPLGDGSDEQTRWLYDFRDILDALPALSPLASATLTLELTPGGDQLETDLVVLENQGLDPIQPPELEDLPAGTSTVSFDLLDYVTSEDVVNAIAEPQVEDNISADAGELLMQYNDDATVSLAELTLTWSGACAAP